MRRTVEVAEDSNNSGDRGHGDKSRYGQRRDEQSTTSNSRSSSGEGRGRPRAHGSWEKDGPRSARQDRPRSVGDAPGTARQRPYRPSDESGRTSGGARRDDRNSSWSQRPRRSEDSGGFRGGQDSRGSRDDKPWEKRDRKDYRPREDRGGARPVGSRPDSRGGREDKPWENRDRRDYRPREDRDARPREDRGGRPAGSRPDSRGGREDKPWENRDRRDYRPREDRGGARPVGSRPDSRGGREDKPWENRDRKDYRPREDRGGARPVGSRPDSRGGREDKPWENRDRKDYRPREDRSGGRPDHARRDSSGRRENKPWENRDRKDYRPREDRAQREDRPWRDERPRRDDRDSRTHRESRESRGRSGGARDHGSDRVAQGTRDDSRNTRPGQEARADRPIEPRIPESITGRELGKEIQAELRGLSKETAERVSRHMVAAYLLEDSDNETAQAHARFAARLGGRVGAVREAHGIIAYRAGDYRTASRELRTSLRITGRTDVLPMIADSERGLGRPERALDIASSEDASSLGVNASIELIIVVAGAYADTGDIETALRTLEIPALRHKVEGRWQVRLWVAYADLLERAGRPDEAKRWLTLAADADTEGVTDAAERLGRPAPQPVEEPTWADDEQISVLDAYDADADESQNGSDDEGELPLGASDEVTVESADVDEPLDVDERDDAGESAVEDAPVDAVETGDADVPTVSDELPDAPLGAEEQIGETQGSEESA